MNGRFDVRQISVRELEELVRNEGHRLTEDLLAELTNDPRSGVQRLARQVLCRIEAAKKEAARLEALMRREREYWKAGKTGVAGVDEVGVGPLAGPVVAAAVILPANRPVAGIDDSKRLSPSRRDQLAVEILEVALAVGIGTASVTEIDSLNIYQASLLAMKRAVEALGVTPQQILVDARTIPDIDIPQMGIIGGDRTCYSIAAASIVAKTHRDELMTEYERKYPGYGFSRHKGYPTADHRASICKLGLSPIHRRSFSCLPSQLG